MSDKTQNDMRLTIDGKFNIPLDLFVTTKTSPF